MQRLADHAAEGLRREKWKAASAAAEAGDASAAAEALFFKVKSFSAALNLFRKQCAKLSKIPSARGRIQTMAGLTAGFDAALLKAITGKDRKKYNGSRGELGSEGQHEVSEMWGQFLLRLLVEHESAGTGAGTSLAIDDWRSVTPPRYLEQQQPPSNLSPFLTPVLCPCHTGWRARLFRYSDRRAITAFPVTTS